MIYSRAWPFLVSLAKSRADGTHKVNHKPSTRRWTYLPILSFQSIPVSCKSRIVQYVVPRRAPLSILFIAWNWKDNVWNIDNWACAKINCTRAFSHTHTEDCCKTADVSFCPAWFSFGCSSGTTCSPVRRTTISGRECSTAYTRTLHRLKQHTRKNGQC